jgi:hypothetical protein
MWYLEPSCMLRVACMTIEWPLSALCGRELMARRMGEDAPKAAVG